MRVVGPMSAWFWAPALVPLAMTAANVLAWPRPHRGPRLAGRISALVPARDESAAIDGCIDALLRTDVEEVLVLDDASSDDTANRVAAWSRRDARVRLLRGQGPPPGWLGKAAACEALRRAATGDWLLFVDADVRVESDLLLRLGPLATDLLTAVPRQLAVGPVERLVIPLLHLSYTSWLFLPAVRRSRRSSVLAANGQLVLARASALARMGGFAAVRAAVVDDMALVRAARRAGLDVDFVDGSALATCRMYSSARALFDGFSKNLYPGIGGHPAALVAVLSLYTVTLLLPWLAAPWSAVAWVGLGVNLLQRLLLAWRFRQPPLDTLAHPLGVLLFLLIAARSAWWSWTRTATWRGRPVTV